MACPKAKESPASTLGGRSMRQANIEAQERPRKLKDLQDLLNTRILKLPLYNFEVTKENPNPPLPQMTPVDPFFPPATPLVPGHDPFFENLKRYATLNQESNGSCERTTPPEELDKIAEGGRICFTGGAGSGKTTTLRIIARNSVTGNHGYRKIEFVHVLHPGPFGAGSTQHKCLARDAIFSCDIGCTDAESKILFDYALKQPRDFLLIFDSLDTLPRELNEIEDPENEYSHDREYPALVHLKMLLSGRLLKGCRVITSSRDHAIRNYKGDLIPTRIVSLGGFSEQDSREVLELYSHNFENIFAIIKDRPHFFSLFKEPVFLVYLVKIWEELRSVKYMRATDVLMSIIRCFVRGDHAKTNYDMKFKNIKKLARGTLWRRKFEFDESSLADYDLKMADLTDLRESASDKSGRPIILKLTTGESPSMFSHQSIHEMFAALSVVESKFHKFEEEIGKMQQPFFHQTRVFVYGLVFGKCNPELGLADIDRKRAALKKDIENRFRITASPLEQLSIFETLAEAITDVRQFDLETAPGDCHGVNLTGIPMNDWSLYCTGMATSQFAVLKVLHLEGCGIQLSQLRALDVGIRRFSPNLPQILSFSLKNNPGIGLRKESVEIACKIVRKCKVNDFNIGACGLNSESMSELLRGLSEATVAALGLEHNPIGGKGMEIAGTIVKQCSIKEINLSHCATSIEEAEAFGKYAKGADIHRLIVEYGNEEVVCGYGNVVRDCSLRVLVILLSTLEPGNAKRLAENSSSGKITKLQFSVLLINVNNPLAGAQSPKESDCESIRYLLPIVKEEVDIPVGLANNLIENLQSSLDDLKHEGPVIKFPSAYNTTLTLTSKNRQSPTGPANVDKCEDKMSSAAEKQLDSEDEIAMESEYLDITHGSGTMAWLKRYKRYPGLVADIFSTYGLSIHRYEMKAADCQLVAEILSHCEKLKKFSFTHSKGLQPLMNVLREWHRKASSKKWTLHATRVCFAGYNGIDKTLSRLFVECVTLFKAEGLVLTSSNVSHGGLQCLRKDLGNIQGEHFKSLEIFRNPCIGDQGWETLADIATDFSNVGRPLNLSACYCGVEDKRLSTFKKALQGAKLGKIDICGSRKLTEEGFRTLGEIVRMSECPSVTLQDCDLDVEKAQSFNSGRSIASSEKKDEKMQSLNVADNPDLGLAKIAEIKKIIRCFGVRNLNIGSCRLECVDFDHSFESLDISGNPRCKGIPELAKSVSERLHLRNCKLSKCDLKNLASNLRKNKRKLKALDISEDSKQMDYENVEFLVEVFKDVTESVTVADNFTIDISEVHPNGTT